MIVGSADSLTQRPEISRETIRKPSISLARCCTPALTKAAGPTMEPAKWRETYGDSSKAAVRALP